MPRSSTPCLLAASARCYRSMMYRDDQEALHARLDGTSREAERLRKENESMRAAVGRMQLTGPSAPSTLMWPPSAVYSPIVDIRAIPLEERARLAAHSLQTFPVWLVGILNLLTFGIFPFFHF